MTNDDGAGAGAIPQPGLASDGESPPPNCREATSWPWEQYDKLLDRQPCRTWFAETGNSQLSRPIRVLRRGAARATCSGHLGHGSRCRTGKLDGGLCQRGERDAGRVRSRAWNNGVFGAGWLGFALVFAGKRSAAIAVPVLLAAVSSTGVRAQGPT